MFFCNTCGKNLSFPLSVKSQSNILFTPDTLTLTQSDNNATVADQECFSVLVISPPLSTLSLQGQRGRTGPGAGGGDRHVLLQHLW